MTINKDLRVKIVEMISKAGEGHIPSSFSILDIIHFVYDVNIKNRAIPLYFQPPIISSPTLFPKSA